MENNNLLDFLVVGAAKAGTTSLHKYLETNKDCKIELPIQIKPLKKYGYLKIILNKM